MRLYPSVIRFRSFLPLAALSLSLTPFAMAQETAGSASDQSSSETQPVGNGIIAGRVFDSESGDPISGVTVTVGDSASLLGVTDSAGQYEIADVPAGNVDLNFVKSSYQTARMKNVVVNADTITKGDFPLAPLPDDANEYEGFVFDVFEIEATEVSQALANLELRLESSSLLDVMGSEEFSRFAASDIADAVKSVSGVSVSDGKFAVVRGLDDRYNVTMLNGVIFPSPDPDRVAVPLDIFPTGIFDRIETTKSHRSDLPGEASGGAIDLKFKGIPEERSITVSFGMGLNTNSQDNWFTANNSGDSYLLANGAEDRSTFGELGGGSGLIATQADFQVAYATALSTFPPVLHTNPSIQQAAASLARGELSNAAQQPGGFIEQQSESNFERYVPQNRTPSPDTSFGFSYSDRFELSDDEVFGLILSASHSISHGTKNGEEIGDLAAASEINADVSPAIDSGSGVQNKFSATDGKLGDYESSLDVLLSSVAGLTYELGDNHELGYRMLYLRSGEDTVIQQENRHWTSGFGKDDNEFGEAPGITYTLSSEYIQREQLSQQLLGQHDLTEDLGFEFDWAFLFSSSEQQEPETFIIRRNINGADPENSPAYQDSFPDYGMGVRYDRSLTQDSYGLTSSVTVPLAEYLDGVRDRDLKSNIVFGFSVDHSSRNFLQSEQSAFAQLDTSTPASDLLAGSDLTADYRAFDPAVDTADAEGERTIYAGNLLVEFDVNESIELIAGVRFETTELSYTGFGRLVSFPNGEPNTSVSFAPSLSRPSPIDQADAIPSVNLNIDATETVKLRFAASKTVSRPTYRELQPYPLYNVAYDEIEIGNPGRMAFGVGTPVETPLIADSLSEFQGLRMADIENLDARIDWRPADGTFISLGIFHKTVQNPIERIEVPGAANLPVTTYTFVNNNNNASVRGVELDVRENLGNLSEYAGGPTDVFEFINVGGNITYIDASVKRSDYELAAYDDSAVARNPIRGTLTEDRRLFNQPEMIGNAFINLDLVEVSGTDLTLSMNYTGDSIIGVVGPTQLDVYQDEVMTLNFVAKQEIPWVEGMSVKFAAKNITDPAIKRFAGKQTFESGTSLFDAEGNEVDQVTYDAYKRGVSFSLGLEYRF